MVSVRVHCLSFAHALWGTAGPESVFSVDLCVCLAVCFRDGYCSPGKAEGRTRCYIHAHDIPDLPDLPYVRKLIAARCYACHSLQPRPCLCWFLLSGCSKWPRELTRTRAELRTASSAAQRSTTRPAYLSPLKSITQL
jgi:hypothetical protein